MKNLSNIITGKEAKQLFDEFKYYYTKGGACCVCGEEIKIPVAKDRESEYESEPIILIDFFCSQECAEQN